MAAFRPDFNILPDKALAGGLLPWIIAVMIYLSALAVFGAVSLQWGIAQWSDNLERSFTVQVPAETAKVEDFGPNISAALRAVDGVAQVEVLSQSENMALLETWLGKGNVTDELPVPALVDVTLADDAQVTQRALDAALEGFAGARVERSATWLGQLNAAALGVIANAYFIVLLVTAATLAVVIFGTRAHLAAFRQTILIVHHMGAEDQVIAREFQLSFLRLGFWGGLFGTGLALATVFILSAALRDAQVGLVSVLVNNWLAALFIAPIPLVAALLTMVTARLTVLSALKSVL